MRVLDLCPSDLVVQCVWPSFIRCLDDQALADLIRALTTAKTTEFAKCDLENFIQQSASLDSQFINPYISFLKGLGAIYCSELSLDRLTINVTVVLLLSRFIQSFRAGDESPPFREFIGASKLILAATSDDALDEFEESWPDVDSIELQNSAAEAADAFLKGSLSQYADYLYSLSVNGQGDLNERISRLYDAEDSDMTESEAAALYQRKVRFLDERAAVDRALALVRGRFGWHDD